ncbi:MAG: glycosyl transferase family protein [Verrucomicrobia bacterium]|nr:glycosyl transferase family protein [Verrucomicrobiota bacterium]
MTPPDLSIVIINWNGLVVLRDCLASIHGAPQGVTFEVIVVDNASTDESVAVVRRDYPEVIILCNEQNRGFAAANNQAFAVSRGRHVLLLNNDTVVLPNALKESVRYLDANPGIGMLGCRVEFPDRSFQTSCYRFNDLLEVFWIRVLPMGSVRRETLNFGRYFRRQFKDPTDVDVVAGCFAMLPRGVIAAVGGFDEDFFMYGEDEEWCSRIKRAGWRITYFPGATIIHLHRFSSKKARRALRVIECMSPVLVLHKRRGPVVAWCANLFLLAGFLLRLPAWIVLDVIHLARKTAQPRLLRSRFTALFAHLKGLFRPIWLPRKGDPGAAVAYPLAAESPVKSEPGAGPVTLRVTASFEAAETLRNQWDDLVVRAGGDVYQTYDWCRIWWKHYGDRRQLHLLLFYSGEELVGIIPAFTEILWLGPVRVKAAKMVGGDSTIHLCNLPVLSSALRPAVSQALDHFLGNQACDVLLFGPLAGTAARLDEILAAGQEKRRLVATTRTSGSEGNTYFHLPASFEDYLKGIGKQQRGNFTRTVTQLSTLHPLAFDAVSDPAKVEAEFEEFRRLHDAQWQSEGKLGHFGDWPGAEAYTRDLVRVLGAKGMVRFHRILANNEVISSQFSFVFRGTSYWRLPARVWGAKWDRSSLGRMGLIKMIAATIEEGSRVIEGGRGHYSYKVQLGGTESPLRTVEFVRRGFGVTVRMRLFRLLARFLDIVYFKVLFVRAARKFPFLRRPLWVVWIRAVW